MTLLFCDGFDHYNTLPGGKWNGLGTNAPLISSAYARTGGGGMGVTGSNNQYVTLSFGNQATLILGFAVRVQTTMAGSEQQILNFVDGANNQVTVGIAPAGNIRVYRSTTPNLGTSNFSLQQGVWAYLEFQVTFSTTVGVIKMRVNGVQDAGLNLSGLNTAFSGQPQCNGIFLGALGFGSPTINYDDLVLMSTAGSVNNAFLGDVIVGGILPNANGTENDFSLGGSSLGTLNYQQVNENPPNDDTSYVVSPTVGNIDRYLYPSSEPPGTPYAVVVWNRARKDDVGGRLIRAAVKSGGTVSDNGSDLGMAINYQYLMGLFETDPNTSAAWTLANIQAAEFGVKVTG